MKMRYISKNNNGETPVNFLHIYERTDCAEGVKLFAILPAKEAAFGIDPLEQNNQFYVLYANGSDKPLRRKKRLTKMVKEYTRFICKKKLKKPYKIISFVTPLTVGFRFEDIAMHPIAVFQTNEIGVMV